MPWNDVGQEQMVSYTDAQTSGFALRANQSQTTSNQCMTKNDALTKYLLKSENMAAYTDNQLVPKKEWAAGLTQLASGFNGPVWAIEYQPDGKVVIGGEFTTYKGVTVNHIVRLFPDGTLDTDFIFGTNCNNSVFAIAILNDGRIAIGGKFTTYNSVTVNRFCILNSSGTLNTTMTGANNDVLTIAIKDDFFYIGGFFTTFNGSLQGRIISLNIFDNSFNPVFNIITGFNNNVWTIHIGIDGKIYVGGTFNRYKSGTSSESAADRAVRLSENGDLLNNYGVLNGVVHSIVTISNGNMICGGTFDIVRGINRGRITSYNSSGTNLNEFGVGFNSGVTKITVVENEQLLVSGQMGNYKTVPVNPSVKLFFGLQTYNLNTSFNPDFNDTVLTHATDSNNNILYGGFFTTSADLSVTRTSNRISQFSSAGVLISD